MKEWVAKEKKRGSKLRRNGRVRWKARKRKKKKTKKKKMRRRERKSE